MRTYTEEEIKKWFETMKQKYPNSNTFDHLTSVEYMMFNETFGDSNCLKKIKQESWQNTRLVLYSNRKEQRRTKK